MTATGDITMAQGLRLWDASGNLILDTNTRVTKLVNIVSLNGPSVSIPGITPVYHNTGPSGNDYYSFIDPRLNVLYARGGKFWHTMVIRDNLNDFDERYMFPILYYPTVQDTVSPNFSVLLRANNITGGTYQGFINSVVYYGVY